MPRRPYTEHCNACVNHACALETPAKASTDKNTRTRRALVHTRAALDTASAHEAGTGPQHALTKHALTRSPVPPNRHRNLAPTLPLAPRRPCKQRRAACLARLPP